MPAETTTEPACLNLRCRQPDGEFSPVGFEPTVHPPAFSKRLEELLLRDAPYLRKNFNWDAIHEAFAARLCQLFWTVEIPPKHESSFFVSIGLFNCTQAKDGKKQKNLGDITIKLN